MMPACSIARNSFSAATRFFPNKGAVAGRVHILHALVDFHLVDVVGLLFLVVDSRNEQVRLNLCEETARIVLN